MLRLIHGNQETEKETETWKQNRRRQKIQGSNKREIELIGEKVWGKRKKKKLIDAACESSNNTVFEEHFSSENIHSTCRWYEVASYRPPTSSQQTVEPIEGIQEVVSPEIFKLNHSVMKKARRLNGSRYSKMDQVKFVENSLQSIHLISYLIDSSMCKKFVHLALNVYHAVGKKR